MLLSQALKTKGTTNKLLKTYSCVNATLFYQIDDLTNHNSTGDGFDKSEGI